MAYIEFHRINKLYEGGVHAIEDVSFGIEKGQFTVLVGPSGCGKSTFLRMLAGLEEVTTGTIKMDGKIINEVHPKDRNISMVFQNYALYPHLTVYENIAFGLKLKRIKTPVTNEAGEVVRYRTSPIPKEEIDQKVKEVAEKLELTAYLSRKPKQLSGGQKQRVALARALVRNNDVFLLDEPLSNLDAKLRVEMRKVIKTLHQNVKKPFVYVTHDQVEAMTMADKIVVLKLGVIQQIGSPKEIYDEPSNLFVATFFGSPSMSIIDGTLIEDKGSLCVQLKNNDKLYIPKDLINEFLDYSMVGKDVKLGFRPTSYRVSKPEHIDHYSMIHGEVFYKELFGSETLIKAKIAEGNNIDVFIPNDINPKIGDTIELYAHTARMKIFDPVSERSIFGTTKTLTIKDINYEINDENIIFDFAGENHLYPIEKRVINSIEKHGKLNISFDTENITLEEIPHSISISGKVVLVKNLFNRNAIFVEVKGRKEPLFFYLNKDKKIEVGDKVTMFIDYDYVSFHNVDNTPILSRYDIVNEVKESDITIVKKAFKITNGDNIKVPLMGVKAITNRKDVRGSKEEFYKVKAICLDVEDYNGNTLLYYKIKGMKGYLTAILDKKIDMVKQPIVKLKIPKK